MSDFDYVTGWSARKRHIAQGDWMLCGQGIPVRPGGSYAGIHKAPMTQERIDAMDLCKICARIEAFHAKEA